MASSALLLLSFVALFAGSQCDSLVYKDCGSKTGKVHAVRVNTTVQNNVALLKKGTSVQLEVDITSDTVSDSLKAVVHGILGPATVPFPLGNNDGCKNCNITCPVKKGTNYTYKPVIKVMNAYPSISLVVKWELRDSNSNDILCIDIPVMIVS